MEEQLIELVADFFDIEEDQVTDQLSGDSVDDWDSLRHLQLITAVEGEFNIKLSMAEIESINNFGRLKELINKYAG